MFTSGTKFKRVYSLFGTLAMMQNKKATVTKQWRGCAVECCTAADSILIEFPSEMTAVEKANLIAAVFLTDMNLWERQGNNQ